MKREIEIWRASDPMAIAEGSRAQITIALTDCLLDISELADCLCDMPEINIQFKNRADWLAWNNWKDKYSDILKQCCV